MKLDLLKPVHQSNENITSSGTSLLTMIIFQEKGSQVQVTREADKQESRDWMINSQQESLLLFLLLC